jgi:biopolymer transport protein ExbD
MKFPRNAKVFRGQIDAAPWASLFLILLIFFFLNSLFFRPSGVYLTLPEATILTTPTNAVRFLMLDENGQKHFENQILDSQTLQSRLTKLVESLQTPLTLVVQADGNTELDAITELHEIARTAGLDGVMFAAKPKQNTPTVD